MARTVRDASLETRTARTRLKLSGKPYYRAIDPGLHLDYRKGRAGGKWVMRWYVGEGEYKVEIIGTADDSADADALRSSTSARRRHLFVKRHIKLARDAKGLSAEIRRGDPAGGAAVRD
jgi:hypothetical protein